MKSIEITYGIPKNQKLRVAKIIFDGFWDKYVNIFGSRRKSIYALVQFLREERTIVALQKGVVVGVGGLKFKNRGFMDLNLPSLIRILGLGTLRAILMGWPFYIVSVKENELFIDSLAVAKNMRCKGVGSLLIEFVVDFARSNEYSKIKLLVIERNWRAIKLYKKMGFKEEESRNIPFPLDRLFGFRKIKEMIRRTN